MLAQEYGFKLFFLLNLNEEMSHSWLLNSSLVSKNKKLNLSLNRDQIEFIRDVVQYLDSINFKHKRNQNLPLGPLKFWVLPDSFLKSWIKFCKRGSYEELIAVILNGLLGFSIEVIAEAVKVPDGTIRFRLGHGYRKLGSIKDEATL